MKCGIRMNNIFHITIHRWCKTQSQIQKEKKYQLTLYRWTNKTLKTREIKELFSSSKINYLLIIYLMVIYNLRINYIIYWLYTWILKNIFKNCKNYNYCNKSKCNSCDNALSKSYFNNQTYYK